MFLISLIGTTISQSVRNIYGIAQPERRPNRVIQTYIPSNARNFNPGPNILIRNPVTVRTWYNVGAHAPLPVILNTPNYLPKTTPNSDAIVTKSIPEATTINDYLKTSITFKDDDENGNMATEKVTEKPSDYGNHTVPNMNDDEKKTTDKAATGGLIGVIIKKHFYFQVKPVTPEGETDEEMNEIVYYID